MKISGTQIARWTAFVVVIAFILYSLSKCADEFKNEYTEPEVNQQDGN